MHEEEITNHSSPTVYVLGGASPGRSHWPQAGTHVSTCAYKTTYTRVSHVCVRMRESPHTEGTCPQGWDPGPSPSPLLPSSWANLCSPLLASESPRLR